MVYKNLIDYIQSDDRMPIFNRQIQNKLYNIISEVCYKASCFEDFYDFMKILGGKVVRQDINYCLDLNSKAVDNYWRGTRPDLGIVDFSADSVRLHHARLMIGINEYLIEQGQQPINLQESLELIKNNEKEYDVVVKRIT